MNKKYSCLIFTLFFVSHLNAQFIVGESVFDLISVPGGPSILQLDHLGFSNYHFFNPYQFNPAMAGINEGRRINLDWKRENYGRSNRKIKHDFYFNYEQALPFINSGIGFYSSYYDFQNYEVFSYGMAYNYALKIKEVTSLRFGIQFSQTHIHSDIFNLSNSPDKNSWSFPNMDIGAAFKWENLTLGISYQDIFPNESKVQLSSSELTLRVRGKYLNFSGAYTQAFSKNWKQHFAFLFRKPNQEDMINDYSSYISFRDKYFAGYTYRTNVEHHSIIFVGWNLEEKINLQFSFNSQRYEKKPRALETLVQYQF